MVINCRLHCGAVFHMCKEEEHKLLCPHEKVPCLNAEYGCPFSMLRFKLAKHLEVCPASTVSCSMEWNRWPLIETETILNENVMKEPYSEENLDLSMALRDQRVLLNSLKMEQRCPLSYLGCTYSQKKFCPARQKAKVTYSQELSTFTLKPEVSPLLFEGVKTNPTLRKRARNLDSLSSLPFEMLQHIAGFLDSLALSQLAQVSQYMREVCSTLLQERGMVSLKWEKKTYSHGGSSWRARKKVSDTRMYIQHIFTVIFVGP
ncbi:UNVERIFIED_CONTAM: hypothetical protein FKN15_072146 [Acipenser sinensis]